MCTIDEYGLRSPCYEKKCMACVELNHEEESKCKNNSKSSCFCIYCQLGEESDKKKINHDEMIQSIIYKLNSMLEKCLNELDNLIEDNCENLGNEEFVYIIEELQGDVAHSFYDVIGRHAFSIRPLNKNNLEKIKLLQENQRLIYEMKKSLK